MSEFLSPEFRWVQFEEKILEAFARDREEAIKQKLRFIIQVDGTKELWSVDGHLGTFSWEQRQEPPGVFYIFRCTIQGERVKALRESLEDERRIDAQS